jgi:hypothetical protein
VTVKDEDDEPLENATVRVSEGINVFTVLSDASGVAEFNLDAATYALGIFKDGYQFTPTSIVVTAPDDFIGILTRIVIPGPSGPNQCVCSIVTRNARGAAQAGVKVSFSLVSAPTPDSYATGATSATSDGTGLLTVELRKGAHYNGRRGSGVVVPFDVPDADEFELPQVLGDP